MTQTVSNPPAPTGTTQGKICGLGDWAAVQAAAAGGAAYVGFVFAPSRRQVTPATAASLIARMRAAYGPRAPRTVGLFVNAPLSTMQAVIGMAGLDVVQLCGDEAPDAELLAALAHPIMRVLRPAPGTLAATVQADARAWRAAATRADRLAGPLAGPWGSRLLIGLDAHHAGQYGGTGRQADWSLAATLAREEPLMLAGGLTPATVAAACAHVRPWLADVSSGVETDGQKDPALIRAFLANVRET